MAPPRARRGTVLVDTNVILECHATRCWAALCGAFVVETVEKCVEETQTGRQGRRPELQIDEALLRAGLAQVHQVGRVELAAVDLAGGSGLHAGERHLWAHALTREDAWILCGPDTASLRFGYSNGLGGRLTSVGGLLSDVNMALPRGMRDHFGRRWHDERLTEFRFEEMDREAR